MFVERQGHAIAETLQIYGSNVPWEMLKACIPALTCRTSLIGNTISVFKMKIGTWAYQEPTRTGMRQFVHAVKIEAATGQTTFPQEMKKAS